MADLLDPPPEWAGQFDFVLESLTVQSLPREIRPRVVAAVRSLVAPGGSVLVIAAQEGAWQPPETGPWPLNRRTSSPSPGPGSAPYGSSSRAAPTATPRWRAEFRRDG